MGHITFPSIAATASRNWIAYEDRVEIPTMDLMKNMELTGASHLILLAFKNIEKLMEHLSERYYTLYIIIILLGRNISILLAFRTSMTHII